MRWSLGSTDNCTYHLEVLQFLHYLHVANVKMVVVLDKQNHVPLIHGLFFSYHHACNEYKIALIQVIEFSMGLACTWAATLTLIDIIISDMYMHGSFPCLTLVRPTPLVHSESFKLSLSQTTMRSMRVENSHCLVKRGSELVEPQLRFTYQVYLFNVFLRIFSLVITSLI